MAKPKGFGRFSEELEISEAEFSNFMKNRLAGSAT